MRRFGLLFLLVVLAGGAILLLPDLRSQARGYARAILHAEPPAPITPIAVTLPQPTVSATPIPLASPTLLATPTSTDMPVTATLARTPVPAPPTLPPSPTPWPTAIPTAEAVVINGRVYDAYIAAATKQQQAYQYSCEFDAAWVILQTYGFDVNVDDLISLVGVDTRIEPYIGEATDQGHIIYGGDITSAFSGDYANNFLARSSGAAIRKAFEHYDLPVTPVHDRAGVEQALRAGALIWMKTTVDFKPWRPAIWYMPDGQTYRTVLGNDHAVVVMGFNADVVVIRDVLGPTSSNWQRPYEYEVDWPTFLSSWEAQSFDGLAVAPPAT